MKLEPSLEELLQIDEIISSFSEEELLEMGHRLNRFEWPDALGSAPEGFEEMIPGLKLFHIDPWARAIELHTSKKARLRYVHTRELGRSEEQFEDWWQSEMFQMMENMDGRPRCHGAPGRIATILSIAAMAISLAAIAMR